MKKQKIFFGILAFLSVLFNTGFIVLKIVNFTNPKIVGFTAIGSCLLAMVLPLGLSLFLFFRFNSVKRVLKIALSVVTVIAILGSGFYSVLALPFVEVISTTDNISNYLNVDRPNRKTYDLIFPANVPENSTNQSYHYGYEDCSPFDTSIYMLAKWDLPEDEYNAEKERIMSKYPEGISRYNKQSQFTDYFVYYTGGNLNLIFSYSDDTNTVQYVFEGLSGKSSYIHKIYERETTGMEIIIPS